MNIKFPYSKKFLKAALAAALVAAPVVGTSVLVQPGQASATTLTQPTLAPTNGSAPAKQVTPGTSTSSITVNIYHDDKKTEYKAETLQVTITDKSGTLVSSGDTATGEYKTSAANAVAGNVNPAKDTYYVTLSNGKISQTTEVKASGKSEAKVKLYWESTAEGLVDPTDANKGIKKSGAIAGVVYDGATSDTGVISTVTVVSKKTQWTTTTNGEGKFALYVPTGTYDVIVGIEGGKKKIYKGVKVSANQTSLPLEQLNAGETFDATTEKLGFAFDTTKTPLAAMTDPETTKFQGVVNPYSTVSIYTVTSGDTFDVDANEVASADTVYTWVAEKTVTKAKSNNNGLAEFSISVKKNSLAGKTIKFVVTDQAGNVYEHPTLYTVEQIDALPLTVSAAKGTTPDSTKIIVTKTQTTDASPRVLIKVASSAASTPLTGSTATGDVATVTWDSSLKKATIDNIAVSKDQYVNVYEVDSDNKVLKFKAIKIGSTQINTTN